MNEQKIKLKAPEAIERSKQFSLSKDWGKAIKGICAICGKEWDLKKFRDVILGDLIKDSEQYLLVFNEQLGIVHELCNDSI